MITPPWVKFVTLRFPSLIFFYLSQRANFVSQIQNKNSNGKEQLWIFLKYHKIVLRRMTYSDSFQIKDNVDVEYSYEDWKKQKK